MPKKNCTHSSKKKASPRISSNNAVFGNFEANYFYSESALRLLIGDIYTYVSEGYKRGWASSLASFFLSASVSTVLTFATSTFKDVGPLKAKWIRAIMTCVLIISVPSALFFGALSLYQHFNFKQHRDRQAVVEWGFEKATKSCKIEGRISTDLHSAGDDDLD